MEVILKSAVHKIIFSYSCKHAKCVVLVSMEKFHYIILQSKKGITYKNIFCIIFLVFEIIGAYTYF